MPWALAKEEDKKDRLETVLYNLITSISKGAELLSSFMPETSEKILAQLNGGHVTDKPEILFQRLDMEEVMKKVEELHPPVEEKAEEESVIDIEPKEEITFEEFGKMQFQVGEIIACEAVKKSKKLLCSQVKVGSQVKQIVSGIKAHYTRDGREKSNGACEFKTGETGRCFIRGNASLCRRCRRKSCINDTGKRDAGGGRNLLRLCPTACNKVTNRLLRERRRTQ